MEWLRQLAGLLGRKESNAPAPEHLTAPSITKAQVDKSEKRPDFGFGVLDHSFVDYTVDETGLNRIHVSHQPHIVAIIAAEIL